MDITREEYVRLWNIGRFHRYTLGTHEERLIQVELGGEAKLMPLHEVEKLISRYQAQH